MSSAHINRRQGKNRGRRPQRKTSNVFAMFDQNQIQEFKEAFNMIDQNKDQIISKDDLAEMFASLGKDHSDEYLQKMLDDAPGQINFTGVWWFFSLRFRGLDFRILPKFAYKKLKPSLFMMFLTMFGEKLNGTDPEDVIKNAFQCFDDDGSGKIDEQYLLD